MSERQIETLMRTVHVCIKDIVIEDELEKCRILVMKRGKVVKCERIALKNRGILKELQKRNEMTEKQLRTIREGSYWC